MLRSPRPAAQDSGDAVCERKLAVLLNSQKEFWLLDLFWPSLSLGDLSVFMPRDRCLANAKHWRHTWRPGSILITSFLSNRNRGADSSRPGTKLCLESIFLFLSVLFLQDGKGWSGTLAEGGQMDREQSSMGRESNNLFFLFPIADLAESGPCMVMETPEQSKPKALF